MDRRSVFDNSRTIHAALATDRPFAPDHKGRTDI